VVAELLELDAEISSALSACSHDQVVVSHLAYGHLAERYGFHQTGLSGISAEFESGPQQVAEIVHAIRENGIHYILQEPIADDRLAETIAAETGAQILELHPLEALTDAETAAGDTYFTVMRRNLETLTTALECS
jgi:zinc transport system substrate-binding protein